ncbi:MAG: hypothetical protein WKF97_14935 [Chitinophagaceae bacterium]
MYRDYSSFENLTKAASIYPEDIGRSKQTVAIYKWIWGKIEMYMNRNRIDDFTPKTITDYLISAYRNKSISELTRHQKHCLRCALCLAQFAETNKMVEVIHRRESIALTGEIGELMAKYVEWKKSLRLNEKTLRGYSWYLYQFLKYLKECETYNPDLLSPLKIMKYAATLLPNAAGAKHLALSIIQNFLRYLYDEEKTRKDLSLIVPKDNYKKQPRLPSTYTKQEVLVILNSIDRSTSVGKRDYAMLLLAVRLGMRASDISGLAFDNLFIKIIHTIIWIFFNVVLFYMAYAVIINKIDKYVWIGVALILLGGIVLLVFEKMCPITLIARQYSDSTKANFDIFLPNWLAKNNKAIYTIIFILIICMLIYRITTNEK